jgi:uncharacterized protein
VLRAQLWQLAPAVNTGETVLERSRSSRRHFLRFTTMRLTLRGCCAVASLGFVSCARPTLDSSEYSGPIIDAHAHLRLGENDAIQPAQTVGTRGLRDLDERAGVSRSALIVIARSGDMPYTRAKNDSLLAAVAADSTHFYAVASVHPEDGDSALVELTRLKKRGVRQIKLHPNSQEFDVADPKVARITQRCGELGLPVLFDSYNPLDAGQLGKLLRLSMSQPKTQFVFAHMGFSQFRETIVYALLKRLGAPRNVYFDLSAIATTYATSPMADELLFTMRQIGMDRMIFGSDWPVDTPARALEAVRALHMTVDEQRLVLHDNAATLLLRTSPQ